MTDTDPRPSHYRVATHVRIAYSCIRIVLGPIVRLIWIRSVSGAENIPQKGGVLIAANHESYFDFICTIAVARRNIYYLAAEKFFRSPLWRPLMKATGQIEVDREHKESREHIDGIVLDLLAQGYAIGIYPEGTRAPTSTELLRAYPGVIRYAKASGCPIVPVGIKGTYQVMSRFDKRPHFSRIVELRFGAAIRFAEDTASQDVSTEHQVTALMTTLAALSGKRYPYGDVE